MLFMIAWAVMLVGKYRNINFKKQRKETIMMVLGMVFAVVVACLAEVGVISNKMNWIK